jgi:hypothetical protein
MSRWDQHETHIVFVGVRMPRGTKRQLDALCRHLQQHQSVVLRHLIEEQAKRLGLHREPGEAEGFLPDAGKNLGGRTAEAVPA